MIEAGAFALGGLCAAGGFVGLALLCGYLADEARIYFGVGGLWATERRSHDDASDDDDQCALHGALIASETTAGASGKFPSLAGGAHG